MFCTSFKESTAHIKENYRLKQINSYESLLDLLEDYELDKPCRTDVDCAHNEICQSTVKGYRRVSNKFAKKIFAMGSKAKCVDKRSGRVPNEGNNVATSARKVIADNLPNSSPSSSTNRTVEPLLKNIARLKTENDLRNKTDVTEESQSLGTQM